MPATLEQTAQAEAALEAALANATLPDGTPLNAKVKIGVGLPKVGAGLITQGDEDEAKKIETMRLTIETPLANSIPGAVRETASDALSNIPVLEAKVQFESDVNHALANRAKMEYFIANGLDIPPNFLEWIGFSDKAERPYDNAYNMEHREGKYALGGRLLGENENVKQFLEDFKADMPEKKEMLVQRIAKYKGIDKKDEAGMSAIRARVNDLVFDTTDQQQNMNGKPVTFIVTTVITKKQQELLGNPETANDKIAIEKAGETNILNELTVEQRNKAIPRAFLFAGAHAKEMFPKMAGRKDMGIAIKKSLLRLKAAKPELATEIDTFLNDDTFKSHYNFGTAPGETPTLKTKAFINKDPDNVSGALTIDLALPLGDADKIIAALANPPQKQENPAPDGKLAVAGDTATTEVGAIEKAPSVAIDPAAIAAAEAAKKAKLQEGPTL
jgi:hypothetical protein